MINFNLPVNAVSFGQVSTALLREVYKRNLDCCVYPIGPVDLSSQNPDEGFEKWLHQTIKSSPKRLDRNSRTIKLWHIQSSLESVGKDQELITFMECDACTPTEVNILNNQKCVWVTSKYTKSVMEEYGVNNVKYLPLGFDEHNFKKINREYYGREVTVIGVGGKFEEKRKAHVQIIRALLEKYGNNRKFMLHFAIYNPFFSKEQNDQVVNHLTQGKKYFNAVFVPFMAKNSEYNDFLNSCDIFLGCSNSEGFDLPVYQAACLGKKIVALNAHVYPDYLNNDNAWLFEPNGKQIAHDGIFFHTGHEYSQGNFFTWDTKDFLEKLDEAINQERKSDFKYINYSQVLDILMAG